MSSCSAPRPIVDARSADIESKQRGPRAHGALPCAGRERGGTLIAERRDSSVTL